MFIKFVDPNGHQLPFGEPIVDPIKISRRGLTGSDRVAFEKRASGFNIDKILARRKPGEVLLHVIALGCDEFYGPNRNGDAFTKESCRKYHHTFVKYARWFREHDHYEPRKSYGRVLDSRFNERLGRIELIVALNGTKEAAKANKGRVADLELERLAKGEDIPVSMACKVAYDVCSGCGNKARNRSEYCTAETCKYGGCKENLGKTFADGHTLRVFNPEPLFFDISYVEEPADRIAYTIGHLKTASAPAWLMHFPQPEDIVKQAHILEALLDCELATRQGKRTVQIDFSQRPQASGLVKFAIDLGPQELVYHLSKMQIILPFKEWLQVFGEVPESKAKKIASQVRPHLQYLYSDFVNHPKLKDKLAFNAFFPKEHSGSLYNLIEKHSLTRISIRDLQAMRAKPENVKFAAYTPHSSREIRDLLAEYASYQIASLYSWPEIPPYNYVIDMNFTS